MKNNDKKYKFRFMAMSKLIGFISFIFVLIIITFSLYEMHISQIYDALPQLIISSFAFATCYTAFYLTMAKVEHIEIEKTKREKELSVMKKNNSSDEEIQSKKQEIESCCQKINEILSDMNNNQNFM